MRQGLVLGEVLRRALPALILLACAGVAHFLWESDALGSARALDERLNVALGRESLEKTLGGVQADLRYLARHNEARDLYAPSAPAARDALAADFLIFAEEKQIYDQVRFLDRSGREIVRVNHEGGSPRRVPDAELQDKSNRNYFVAARDLGHGAIGVSSLDLNVEHGRPEDPAKPVIRFSTPVGRRSGAPAGLLVLNFLGEPLLEAFRSATAEISGHVLLVDATGRWLVGPRRGLAGAFAGDLDRRLSAEHPDAWALISRDAHGQLDTSEGLYTFATVDPAPTAAVSAAPWKVVAHLPRSAVGMSPAVFLERHWEAYLGIALAMTGAGLLLGYMAARRREAESRVEEQRFRHCVECAPSAIVLCDADGRIVLANQEAERMFGYPREELFGRAVDLLVAEPLRSAHARHRSEFRARPQARRMGGSRELLGQRKDGSAFPVEVGLNPIETEEGLMVLGAIVDITERRCLEDELQHRNEEIARTQTLAAVGRMANMVAHDMRNPLSSIKMGLQIIGKQRESSRTEEELELREIALEQVHYMEEILDDLLSYSREPTLAPEWLHLEKVVEAAVLLVHKHVRDHGAVIETRHQPGLPTLHGDATNLRRALCNLIVNGLQSADPATGEPPRIVISTHLVLAPEGPCVRVEVCDNGRGIDPELAGKVFDPFYTTRASGTGLGLAIVKRIVDQHNGTIELAPGERGGTRVSVILPVGPIHMEATPASGSAQEAA